MLRFKCKSDADLRVKLRTEFCDRLLPKMSEIYWRVVRRCLNNDFDVEAGPREDDRKEGFSLQMAFERIVVSELERCHA